MILKEKHILIILFFNCITGPSLPYGLYDSAMAESPDGRGVILFGGDVSENSYKYENRTLELRAGADSWNVLNVSLQNRRANHVVIPVIPLI